MTKDTRILQPYTLAEIKAKIASHDYSAELLLQHAMLLLEKPAAVAEPGEQNESAYQRGYMDGMAKGRRDVDAATQADSVTASATDSYVQPVPDKCDRIVWRGHYYHLPLTPPSHAPQADSVTAPAATVIKRGADRQWMSERLGHLPDGIYSLYLAPPTQAADSVLEDAARYRRLRDVGDATWVPFRIRTGYSAAQVDEAIDAARKQGVNHD